METFEKIISDQILKNFHLI